MRIRFLRRPVAGRVSFWLDLDNTLHNASSHILPSINRQMTHYVAQTLQLSEHEASVVRNAYWLKYGATLLGMVRHHQTDPHDFLKQTHVLPELDSQVIRDPRMRHLLSRLPGNRIVLTNAPRDYTERVLRLLGIHRWVHAVVTIDDMWIHRRLQPKPARLLWPVIRRRVPGTRHVLFEDTLSHLKTVRSQAMGTVWVVPPKSSAYKAAGRPGYVDHKVRHFGASRSWVYRSAQTGQPGSRLTRIR